MKWGWQLEVVCWLVRIYAIRRNHFSRRLRAYIQVESELDRKGTFNINFSYCYSGAKTFSVRSLGHIPTLNISTCLTKGEFTPKNLAKYRTKYLTDGIASAYSKGCHVRDSARHVMPHGPTDHHKTVAKPRNLSMEQYNRHILTTPRTSCLFYVPI
jgi:hypothetical protein